MRRSSNKQIILSHCYFQIQLLEGQRVIDKCNFIHLSNLFHHEAYKRRRMSEAFHKAKKAGSSPKANQTRAENLLNDEECFCKFSKEKRQIVLYVFFHRLRIMTDIYAQVWEDLIKPLGHGLAGIWNINELQYISTSRKVSRQF